MDTSPETPQRLYWDTSYEIVLQLITHYPNADLETLGLLDLQRMIVSLPDFADDPALAHDAMLTEILREYYEEATNQ